MTRPHIRDLLPVVCAILPGILFAQSGFHEDFSHGWGPVGASLEDGPLNGWTPGPHRTRNLPRWFRVDTPLETVAGAINDTPKLYRETSHMHGGSPNYLARAHGVAPASAAEALVAGADIALETDRDAPRPGAAWFWLFLTDARQNGYAMIVRNHGIEITRWDDQDDTRWGETETPNRGAERTFLTPMWADPRFEETRLCRYRFAVAQPAGPGTPVHLRVWVEGMLDSSFEQPLLQVVDDRAPHDIETLDWLAFSSHVGNEPECRLWIDNIRVEAVEHPIRWPVVQMQFLDALASIQARIDALDGFRRVGLPDTEGLQDALQDFETVAEAFAAAIHQADTMPDAGTWRRWTHELESLDAMRPRLEMEANHLRAHAWWRQAPSAGRPGLAIGLLSPMQKVWPDTPAFSADFTHGVELEAAANETESFQVVVSPRGAPLSGIRLIPQSLAQTGGAARIPAEHIRWHVVHTFTTRSWNMRGRLPIRPVQPDPLEPGRPVDIPEDRHQSLWVDVFVPPGTPAGAYTGTLVLESPHDGRFDIPVSVTVWNFELPAENRLKLDFWYHERNVRLWFGLDRAITPEEFDRHLAVLERYRLPTYMAPYAWSGLRMVVREPDGRFTFDFSTIDAYLEKSFARGLNAFNANFSCHWRGVMSNNVHDRMQVLDRETGRWARGVSEAEADAIIRELLPAYVQHLKARGWFEAAFFQVMDEPGPAATAYPEFIRRKSLVHEIAPELRRLAAGVGPESEALVDGRRVRLDDYVEITCPVSNAADRGSRIDATRRAREAGKETWWYVCGSQPLNLIASKDPIAHRILFWKTWQYGFEGLLYYGINLWPVPEDPAAARWPDAPIEHPQIGNGVLAWPGRSVTELWPGIRLSSIRDGLEDYAYLAILSDHLERLRDVDIQDPAVRARIEVARALVQVPDALSPAIGTLPGAERYVDYTEQYARNPAVLYQVRRDIARTIEWIQTVAVEPGPLP